MGGLKMAVTRGPRFRRRSVLRWISGSLAFITMMFTGTLTMSSASNAAQSGKGTTITLYYAAPLTGGANYDGIQGCNGEKLAARDINAKGGIPRGPLKGAKFAVQCLDDKDTSSIDSSIAARYVANPSVWAMGGFYSSGSALAAAIVAERSGLAIIASNVAADFLTTQVHNVYTMLARLQSAGGAAADFCKSYYGATNVAALVPNYSYISSYMAGVTSALKKDSLSLVSNQTWPDGQTTSWSPYLSQLSASAQCLLLGAYPPEQCEITSQARQMGLSIPSIDLTDSFTSTSCAASAGKYYEGMIFGNLLPAKASAGSLLTKVSTEFQAKFHQQMSYYAGNGYDSVLAVEYAVMAGATNRTQLLKYLAKDSGAGVTGPISFVKQRIGLRYLSFLEVASSGGSLQPVAEYSLAPNGNWKRLFVDICKARPSCQTNLGASS
jgi:branched-chain amino acid transport system substrate-binding protein